MVQCQPGEKIMSEYNFAQEYRAEQAAEQWEKLMTVMLPKLCTISTHKWFAEYFESLKDQLMVPPVANDERAWKAQVENKTGQRYRYTVAYRYGESFKVQISLDRVEQHVAPVRYGLPQVKNHDPGQLPQSSSTQAEQKIWHVLDQAQQGYEEFTCGIFGPQRVGDQQVVVKLQGEVVTLWKNGWLTECQFLSPGNIFPRKGPNNAPLYMTVVPTAVGGFSWAVIGNLATALDGVKDKERFFKKTDNTLYAKSGVCDMLNNLVNLHGR